MKLGKTLIAPVFSTNVLLLTGLQVMGSLVILGSRSLARHSTRRPERSASFPSNVLLVIGFPVLGSLVILGSAPVGSCTEYSAFSPFTALSIFTTAPLIGPFDQSFFTGFRSTPTGPRAMARRVRPTTTNVTNIRVALAL